VYVKGRGESGERNDRPVISLLQLWGVEGKFGDREGERIHLQHTCADANWGRGLMHSLARGRRGGRSGDNRKDVDRILHIIAVRVS